MITLLLLSGMVSQAPETSRAAIGALSVSVFDGSGAMVTDLRADEVTLKEDGQVRAVKRVERDTRPLALALLVDSNDAVGQGVLKELADPVMDFLESLPAGVDRTLMTIGTPPKVMGLEDPAQTRTLLKTTPPFGKLSLYDGLAQACDRLGQKRGSRRAIVVLLTDRFAEDDQQTALEAAWRAYPLVLAIQFHGEGSYAPGLDAIVKWSGGRYEQIGAATGVGKVLKRLTPELDAPWLVVYDTPSAAGKRKVEVKVSRKSTKVRWRSPGLS
jgi:hypothetical protein